MHYVGNERIGTQWNEMSQTTVQVTLPLGSTWDHPRAGHTGKEREGKAKAPGSQGVSSEALSPAWGSKSVNAVQPPPLCWGAHCIN